MMFPKLVSGCGEEPGFVAGLVTGGRNAMQSPLTTLDSGIIMRFALLGNHPDGLACARALCATGRHELIVVEGTVPPTFAPQARVLADLEGVLAEADLDLVIVAGALSIRAAQLRRALQSEHDVLCVH